MKKSNILIIVVATLLVIILFFFLNKKTHKDWDVNLGDSNSRPYDISLIKTLIRESTDKKKYFVNAIELDRTLSNLDKEKKYNYIAIGAKLYYDEQHQYALDSFIKAGNNALICLQDFESLDDLIFNTIDTTFRIFGKSADEIAEETAEEFENETNTDEEVAEHNVEIEEVEETPVYNPYEDNPFLSLFKGSKSTMETESDVIHYNLIHPLLRKKSDYVLYSVRGVDTIEYIPVRRFKANYFSEQSPIYAGYIMDENDFNFVIIPLGKGKLMLHCGPELFTNFSLKDEARLEYAEKILSHLDNKADILMESRHFRPIYYEENELRKSPISFILSQRSLRWAWYLLLATVIIFLVFASKRKQAVIPIIEPLKNTSLEYIKTVGQLYFLDKDHLLLAREIRNHFFVFVKNKYQLTLQIDEEDRFIQSLSMKSEITADEVRKILQLLNNATNHQAKPNEKMLMELYHQTEYFYKRCK